MDSAPAPNNRSVVYRGRPERESPRLMPWTGKQFAASHNHSLSKGEAESAAKQATAMVADGVKDSIAIATANKRINRLRKAGAISENARKKMPKRYQDGDTPKLDAATA